MERLVAWLSYSRLPFVSRLFSSPRLLLEADPVVQECIIAQCERRVYGPGGLGAYEQRERCRWKRLARRSLAQFLCQRAQSELLVRALRSAGFAAATPLLLAFLLVRTWRTRRAMPPTTGSADTVIVFWAERLRKFVWDGMFGEREFLLHTGQQMFLGRAEVRFAARVLCECPRMLAYPEFVCNFLRWLAYYGFLARQYRPRRVVHFFEGTASSSLMTAYLAESGTAHCDIQHGEIVFSAQCAFAEFDEYRLWGEHFRELLTRQRSPGYGMRVVGVPLHRDLFCRVRPSRQPRPARLLVIDPFLHELLWDHDEHFLRILRELDCSWEVRIRRHPADRHPVLAHVARWNADPELSRRGIRVEEERPDELAIPDALERSRVVAGVSSAALLEAWIAGCKVIYAEGGPARSAVMERHGGSPNVCHLADNPNLQRFLGTPACIDATEARWINHLTLVLDDPR